MNVLVANSGGTTPVISDTLAGLYVGLKKTRPDDVVYGSLGSLHGMIEEKAEFNELNINQQQINQIRQYPTSPLGWSRIKFDFKNHPERFENIKKHIIDYKIDTIYLIGGDDTQANVWELHNRLKTESDVTCRVIGIPKTIDKDLPETITVRKLQERNLDTHAYEDRYGSLMKWQGSDENKELFVTHTTPGFISAAQLFAEHVLNTSIEAYGSRKGPKGKGRIYLIEAPGRDAGHLAASAGMIRNLGYGPHGINLPEGYTNVREKAWFSMDHFNNHAISKFLDGKDGNWGVYVLSEGITDYAGNPIKKTEVEGDGHRADTLGGCVFEVQEDLIRTFLKRFNAKLDVRAIRIGSEPLRSNRNASYFDKEYAYSVGHEAAILDALHTLDGVMVSEWFNPDTSSPNFRPVVVPSEWLTDPEDQKKMKALVPRDMIIESNLGDYSMGSHGTVPIFNLNVSSRYTDHLVNLVKPDFEGILPAGELESILGMSHN